MKTKPITQPINPNEPHRYVGKNGAAVTKIRQDTDSLWRDKDSLPAFDVLYEDGRRQWVSELGKAFDFETNNYDLLEIVDEEVKIPPLTDDQYNHYIVPTGKIIKICRSDLMTDGVKGIKIIRILQDFEKETIDAQKSMDHPLVSKPQHLWTDAESKAVSDRQLREPLIKSKGDVPATPINMEMLANEVHSRLLYPNLSSTEGARKKIREVVEFIRGYDPNGSIPELPITFDEYANKILSPAIEQTKQSQKLKQSVHRLRCMAERLEYDDYYYTEDFEREAEAILRELSNG